MGEATVNDDLLFQQFSERIRTGKLHISPYEQFLDQIPRPNFEDLSSEMVFDGTTESAIDSLISAIKAPDRAGNLKSIAILPQVLIRGIIDQNVENPHAGQVERVRGAIGIGLAAYRKDYEKAIVEAEKYKSSLTPEELAWDIHQKDDRATWIGTDPQYSYQTAMNLAFRFPQDSLMLIALGQGATAAGMDVFLRHADITKRKDSSLYVVRFSRSKKNDARPMMSEEEAVYLQSEGKGKQVILFEEDSHSGVTLQKGTDFFRKYVYPGKQVLPISNFNTSSAAFIDYTKPLDEITSF